MKTAAVIAELNPLHNGHAFLFDAVRDTAGADALVVIMSGDFVQRGTPAVFDKYLRAEMALAAGADLVLELPAAAAVSSAQYFAESAVHTLDALGTVDELWFGSEEGRIAPFVLLADLLAEEPAPFHEVLLQALKSGMPYPAAREQALSACLAGLDADSVLSGDLSAFLRQPNNILGLEYVLALRKCGSRIRPQTIRRSGAGYHAQDALPGACASAEAVRNLLLSAEESPSAAAEQLRLFVPEGVLPLYEKGSRDGLMHEDAFSDMLLYRLLQEDAASLQGYADVSAGLADRIIRLLPQFSTFSGFAELLKSRSTTRTQINRALLHILLGITPADVRTALSPSCARLLGLSRSAPGELLSAVKKSSRIPLISRVPDLPLPEASVSLSASRLYEAVRARKNGRVPAAEASRKFLLR